MGDVAFLVGGRGNDAGSRHRNEKVSVQDENDGECEPVF